MSASGPEGPRRTASERPRLDRSALGPDPLRAAAGWLEEAWTASGLAYPHAACLSTVDPEGRPSGRIVLVKGIEERGFIFYTNYRSAKGRSLDARPEAALTLYWEALGRQVRARGPVEKLPPEESDAYFATRPRVSQLGAWASLQSEPLENRGALETRFRDVERKYHGGPVPRPPHWGGFVVRPVEVEFWEEGDYRLHDRIAFARDGRAERWTVVRLNP